MHFSTRLMHVSPPDFPRPRPINPETYRGSTILFESAEDLNRAGRHEYSGITYGTDRLPQQRLLEEELRSLEGASLTRVFPSGINAISETILAFVRAGDHILVCDNAYGPTARFCSEFLARFDVRTTFIPPDVSADIEAFLTPQTRVIVLESPGSNTFEIQDIPAITRIARLRGIVTILDNTWATPIFLDPFRLGVDISIHSVTKYISGHSDLLMGSASTTQSCATQMAKHYALREIHVSPDDCALALRGLKTLPIRMKEHESSALAIASWLQGHRLVESVRHPALSTHPQHELWQRDFTGSSGLFSIVLDPAVDERGVNAFLNSLQLFGIGYSWGGFLSLVTAGVPTRRFAGPLTGKIIIRLNIGLEHREDLMGDLEQGLKKINI